MLEAYGIWHDNIYLKYGYMLISSSTCGRVRCLRLVSAWWKGVSLLGYNSEDPADWFYDGLLKRVVSGLGTSFWNDS